MLIGGTECENYGLPEDVTRRIVAKWWFRRNEVGLLGDEWYISAAEGRLGMLTEFYAKPKMVGKILPLTEEEHSEGFATYRAKALLQAGRSLRAK